MDKTLKSSELATSTLANSYRFNPIDTHLSGTNPGKTHKFGPCRRLRWQPMDIKIDIAKRTENTTPDISKPLRRNNYIVVPQRVPSWDNYVYPQVFARLQIDGATSSSAMHDGNFGPRARLHIHDCNFLSGAQYQRGVGNHDIPDTPLGDEIFGVHLRCRGARCLNQPLLVMMRLQRIASTLRACGPPKLRSTPVRAARAACWSATSPPLLACGRACADCTRGTRR